MLLSDDEKGEMKNKLLGETFGCAILDTGCSKSVCSEIWLEEYIQTLEEKVKENIKYETSDTLFRFGDNQVHQALKKVRIPAEIEGTKFMINADVIDSEIPLLLSLTAMKKAGVIIDTKNERVKMFDKYIKAFRTKVGHLCVALNRRVNVSKLPEYIHHQILITNIEKLNTLTKN